MKNHSALDSRKTPSRNQRTRGDSGFIQNMLNARLDVRDRSIQSAMRGIDAECGVLTGWRKIGNQSATRSLPHQRQMLQRDCGRRTATRAGSPHYARSRKFFSPTKPKQAQCVPDENHRPTRTGRQSRWIRCLSSLSFLVISLDSSCAQSCGWRLCSSMETANRARSRESSFVFSCKVEFIEWIPFQSKATQYAETTAMSSARSSGRERASYGDHWRFHQGWTTVQDRQSRTAGPTESLTSRGDPSVQGKDQRKRE